MKHNKSYHSGKQRSPQVYPGQQSFQIKELSNPGELRMISTSRLTSGLPYQQPISEKSVNRLVLEWDDRLLTPLIVSFRDGKFNVVDGQHRSAAARRRNNGEDVLLPCLVFDGLSYEEEAALCYQIDKTKGRLSLAMSTNALMESGQDAQLLEIRQLLENEGFVWALKKRNGTEFEIVSTAAVIRAYNLLGGTDFSRMFALLCKTWKGNPQSLSAGMISGMALFLKTYAPELNDKLFVKRMSTVHPEEILRRGKVDFSVNSAALRYARVILDKYNRRQAENRKLPYRFES